MNVPSAPWNVRQAVRGWLAVGGDIHDDGGCGPVLHDRRGEGAQVDPCARIPTRQTDLSVHRALFRRRISRRAHEAEAFILGGAAEQARGDADTSSEVRRERAGAVIADRERYVRYAHRGGQQYMFGLEDADGREESAWRYARGVTEDPGQIIGTEQRAACDVRKAQRLAVVIPYVSGCAFHSAVHVSLSENA